MGLSAAEKKEKKDLPAAFTNLFGKKSAKDSKSEDKKSKGTTKESKKRKEHEKDKGSIKKGTVLMAQK